jgi:hypothetical protein
VRQLDADGLNQVGSSSVLLLMAKSEIGTMHVWWTVETLVFQHTGDRENGSAISVAFGEGDRHV